MDSKIRVMYVEDNEMLLDLFKGYFEESGIEVVSFSSAVHALDYFKKSFSTLNAVVVDLKMPELDGFTFFEYAKAVTQHIPYYLLSGHIDETLSRRALSLGFRKVYSKPVRFELLVNEIKKDTGATK